MHRKILIVLWLTLAISTVTYLAYSSFAQTGALHRRSVEENIRELGGLAPIPQSARNVRVGSRWFQWTASFSATGDVIQRWINESPGLRGFIGEQIDNGTRIRYGKLTGNRSVEVIIEEATNNVEVIVRSDPL